MKHKIKKKK